MNKIYIVIIIIILIILSYNIKEGFMPFGYGNINDKSSYIDMTHMIHNYPYAFKLGEIDNTISKKYYKYLNKLHNMHIEQSI